MIRTRGFMREISRKPPGTSDAAEAEAAEATMPGLCRGDK